MKHYNICTKKTFEQNGEEKTKWPQVGTLTEFDNGQMIIELNHLPDTKFYVFEWKPTGGLVGNTASEARKEPAENTEGEEAINIPY